MTLQHRWLTPTCAKHVWGVFFFISASLLSASFACADTITGYNSWQRNGFSRSLASASSPSTTTSSLSNTSTTSGASLTGTVYYDVDGDGVRDSSDWAIRFASVSLTLVDSDVTYSYTTSKNGEYTFANLAAGTYMLTLLTASDAGGITSAGTIDGVADTSAITSASSISNITLTVSATGVNYDFAQYAYPSSLVTAQLLMGSDSGLQNTTAISTTTVPEPGTLALLAVAGLSLAGTAWRRRQRS